MCNKEDKPFLDLKDLLVILENLECPVHQAKEEKEVKEEMVESEAFVVTKEIVDPLVYLEMMALVANLDQLELQVHQVKREIKATLAYLECKAPQVHLALP